MMLKITRQTKSVVISKISTLEKNIIEQNTWGESKIHPRVAVKHGTSLEFSL